MIQLLIAIAWIIVGFLVGRWFCLLDASGDEYSVVGEELIFLVFGMAFWPLLVFIGSAYWISDKVKNYTWITFKKRKKKV